MSSRRLQMPRRAQQGATALAAGLVRRLLRGAPRPSGRAGGGEPVAVYGAGAAGAQLIAQLEESAEAEAIALFDDDPAKQGGRVRGLTVRPPEELPGWVRTAGLRRVLIAMPAASQAARRRVVERLEPLPVRVQTVPALQDLLAGGARLAQIRDVDVADLLGRDAVVPDPALLRGSITGRAVAVTGAGGSIGSELCRQIARLQPARLVLIERNEYNLYRLERELLDEAEAEGRALPVFPLLGSVEDRRRMACAFTQLGVQTVYHAAAYKHVPLVEHNAVEGVRNNAVGTWRCAEAAREAGVERFVLVSTDKAVRPGNVMGASKRLAELTLQALAQRAAAEGGPCYSMVRFGNVLDSSGSVVPLFRDQIRRGGPVTVTHPEATRYFMTIPEAASLVLQAGTLAEGGEVFVLDMGEPVRIHDLARRLIRLSGLTLRDANHPEGEIEIAYTGLRPGEKLHEELLLGSAVTGTHHPMILQAWEAGMAWSRLEPYLRRLEAAAEALDAGGVRALLAETVPEYRSEQGGHDLLGDTATVTPLFRGLRGVAEPQRAPRPQDLPEPS